ncbi:MAG: protein-L-isoaspartate O-methyltransferase [Snowella sp.]|nr:MAG: protein-L-isoaspartate O-methyltransferase [Snowella sp.]
MFISTILLLFSLLLSGLPSWMPGNQNSPSLTEKDADPTAEEFTLYRQYMVQYQIRARGIKDKAVLEAMLTVPRHRFVDPSLAQLAHGDHPLSIDYGQTISQPYIVAYMTEAAEISPEDKVLEIGTGCGYQAAVLGELAKKVYTIEIIPQLAERASRTLKALGYADVQVKAGDGYEGWLKYAPYDAILVTAAPEHIPQPLIEQLAMNGKMVIPVGKDYQEIIVLTKTQEGLITEKTIPVRFVPLRRNSR